MMQINFGNELLKPLLMLLKLWWSYRFQLRPTLVKIGIDRGKFCQKVNTIIRSLLNWFKNYGEHRSSVINWPLTSTV